MPQNLNINAGDPNNPLDHLLGDRPIYGEAGGLLTAANATPPTGEGGYNVNPDDGYIWSNDPRWGQVSSYLSDKGLVQLRNTNIGGPGEAIDPSKVTYDPKAGLVTSPDNIRAPSDGTFWDQYGGWLIVGLGSAAAIGTAAAAAGGSADSAGMVAGTNAAESGGTLTLNAAGTGTVPYVPSEVAGSAAASGATGAPIDESAGLNMNPPSGGSTVPGTDVPVQNGIPDYPADTPTPADTGAPPQGPAPVSNSTPPVPGTSPTAGNGLINSATSNNPFSWYNNLSPASRMIVGNAASLGARAALQGIAQRNAQAAAREQQQRNFDEWNSRHRVSAFGNDSFTPKGIINSNGG